MISSLILKMNMDTLIYQSSNKIYYCDWRLQIYECVYSNNFKIIYFIVIILSFFASLFCFSIFLYRRNIKKYNLFNIKSYILKPNPIDCLMFFLSIFNMLRGINAFILLKNILPSNIIFRSFIFEFPWQIGYCSCVLYFIGILQTLLNIQKSLNNEINNKIVKKTWNISEKMISKIGIIFILMPFITNNLTSILAGIFVENDNINSILFTSILYILWSFYCSFLAFLITLIGIKLLNTIKNSTKNFNNNENLRKNTIKLQLIIITISVIQIIFSIFLLIYGIFREQIIKSIIGTHIFIILFNFSAIIGSFIGCFLLLKN